MAPLRVIQVGVGGMGDAWLRTVAQSADVEWAAWVDVSADILQRQREKYGFDVARCYTSLQAALAAGGADALINVTPPQFHEEVCCTALAAGLPVLSEKPLADTLPAAQRMVAAAEQAGLPLMVAQNYRYQPFVTAMRRAVSSGQYGRPGQVQVSFFKGPHFGGFREEMPSPLIIDMSIHHFDMMRYILGEDAVAVSGHSWNPHWSWFKGDASTSLLFEFASGARVIYDGSWCATGAETTWSADWHIEGDKGVIVCEGDRVQAALTGEPLQELAGDPNELRAQAYLLDEFYRAVTQGIQPATHGRDNLASLGMVFGAVQAVKTGQRIAL